MQTMIAELQRRLARWRAEHDLVAADAHVINLQRTRLIAPVVATIGLVFAL